MALYSHFFISHIKIHHKYVGTAKDPSFGFLGDSVYKVLRRTHYQTVALAWDYENTRLQQKRMSYIYRILMNRVTLYNIGHTLWLTFVAIFLGYRGIVYVFVSALLQMNFLETISYVEHYGLERKMDENGIYEPITIKNSWNAPQRYSSYLLFKLQRHSDHHAHSYKPYQILNNYEDSPVLIGGYPLAVFTALFPSVWFKAYNPIAKAVNEDRKPSKDEVKECERIIYRHHAKVSLVYTIIVYLFS